MNWSISGSMEGVVKRNTSPPTGLPVPTHCRGNQPLSPLRRTVDPASRRFRSTDTTWFKQGLRPYDRSDSVVDWVLCQPARGRRPSGDSEKTGMWPDTGVMFTIESHWEVTCASLSPN